ncbi:MAG: insulinase family protein [Planctomycetota bacterium]
MKLDIQMLPDVDVVELDNGFRALLVERGPLPVVTSVCWYQVGSRDERTGETGVSHFLEHMMFKGTDKFGKGQIDLQTSKMGGSNNAFTDTDSTAYYFSLASDRWETALEIEASRMRDCLLDPAEFQSEKGVVLEELAMGEDEPWRPLYQAVEATMFQVHPYHHPIIGYREELERLSVGGMRDYYERHYGPNRACLTVVGAIDRKRTRQRIEQLFGDMPRVADRAVAIREPEPAGERRVTIQSPHSVTRLCLGFPTCRMGERDDYALDLLAMELGNSKNSRLYRRLVLDDRLCSEVMALNEVRQDPGGFFVMCELHPGKNPDKVERAIREEFAGLIADGIKARDLRRIRTQIESSFLFQDETAHDLAMKLARFEAGTPDGYRTLGDVLPTYESMANDELREVAAKFFRFDRASIAWAVPMGGPGEAGPAARRPAKKAPGKKAPGKKATGRKAPGKKGAAKRVTRKGTSKKVATRKSVANKSTTKTVKKAAKKAKAGRRKS